VIGWLKKEASESPAPKPADYLWVFVYVSSLTSIQAFLHVREENQEGMRLEI
jgi:hypothetical protein